MKIGLSSAGGHVVHRFSLVGNIGFLNTIGTAALTAHILVQNVMMPVVIFTIASAQGNQGIIGWRCRS